MILYFANRIMEIVGQASTALPSGIKIVDDLKTEEVESGVSTFECRFNFSDEIREELERCVEVGNYILWNNGKASEFYTIIESEINVEKHEVYVYAEDAGLDLINEVVGKYAADKAYPIGYYIEKFAYDSGFEIGLNEAADLSRKLSWDGEATVSERLASVATQFDNCEISYSFEVKGLCITKKFINIHRKRGKDIGAQLRINKEISNIITTKSIENLATALDVEGGTPENSETPITLNGYTYDDGDFYVKNGKVCSRESLKKWSRYVWNKEPNKIAGEEGHIVRKYSYDTLNQQTLCNHAITALKKLREVEVNYEADIAILPDNIGIGDRVNIIDDFGSLYLSTRLLKLTTSVTNNEYTATLGEHLLKKSGIAERLEEMADKFAQESLSAKRVQQIANTAKEVAETARSQADSALTGANTAIDVANSAKNVSESATQSANEAQAAADKAQTAVKDVEKDVAGLETSVSNAQAAAEQAQAAASTAQTKANEAHEAAKIADSNAVEAKQSAGTAQKTAEQAVSASATAQSTADTAKAQAETAQTTASAAKLDAETAKKDIEKFSENLETLSHTMTAEYARKTDLTETATNLQTQISQNAGELASTAKKVTAIDETANSAAEQAAIAQETAQQAQAESNAATAKATEAQAAAQNASTAATNAQAEADKAKAAATAAQTVADKADKDLKAAQADLATVQGRVDATESDIVAAQQAVTAAQAAADKAKADAQTAVTNATNAQTTADTAKTNAESAQTVANNAKTAADNAKKVADAAQGKSETAIETANSAQANAESAKSTAQTAVTNATNAQNTANEAAKAAETAQTAANTAKAKAETAQSDLNKAKENLASVTGRVDATEEDIALAQQAVIVAQAAADTAQANATKAQTTADTAKTNATTAQTAANNAKTAADNAKKVADAAQKAADIAQADVDKLSVRTTTAETNIKQNTDAIKLAATKEEVTKTLGGYYTKAQTDAAINVSSEGVVADVTEMISEVDDKIHSNIETTTSLSTQFGVFSNGVETKFEEVKNDINGKTEVINAWIHQGMENGTAFLELGGSTNKMKARLKNERLSFYDGNEELGYFGNKKMNALNAEIANANIDRLQIGKYTLLSNSDGHLTLVYTG